MEEELAAFDYDLPAERIAQTPLEDRAASKLLHLDPRNGRVSHLRFRQGVELLEPGDLLVMNDTRVTALRLLGRKQTGGRAELLLMKEVEENLYEGLSKPAKRLLPGTRLEFEGGLCGEVEASLKEGRKLVRFFGNHVRLRLEEVALAPLPPYISTPLRDRSRYQTVYADRGGSSAAPTAGLHFTAELLNQLTNRGIALATVTLDVGLDTFRPINAENPSEHHMHGERCQVPPETAAAVEGCKGRVIAVGTTAVRTLESFAKGRKALDVGEKVTDIFIRPGYDFRIINGMFTNFHMPRTTMLLMVSALAGGGNIKRAYAEALANDYRFLSFGDSMLIL